MAIVTIGILAHVDAGKTTLTERILADSGVITAVSAVAAFDLNTRTVNLIEIPLYGDVVAEAERSLRALDGVQSQPRRLARGTRAAHLPTPIVVNTKKRLGARGETRRLPCTHFGR